VVERSRSEAPPGTLAETLRVAHGGIRAVLSRVGGLVAEERHEEAARLLDDCAALWGRQARLEEELLYPIFELRLGTSGAGTAAMREEHRSLRETFGRVSSALGAGRQPGSGTAWTLLCSALESHLSREERVVYPTLDALLSDRERGRLLDRIRGG
jgi:hypothetical protein